MKLIIPLLSTLSCLFLASCSSNPQGRIEKNLSLYNQLSVAEQELVSQGQIKEGMSSAAAFLALGEPNRRLEGESNGVRTMRWDYTELTPIYTNSFYGGFGGGYGGGYGRYGRRYRGFGISPTISYVPRRSGSIWFENDKIRSWERIR